MSEAPDQALEAPEPAEIPAAEAPEAAEATEGAADGAEAAAEAPEAPQAPTEPERKPKSPVSQLQGRVGHLTRTLHQKDEAIAERDRQLEAYKALLQAQGKLADGDGAPAAAAPAQPTTAVPVPGTPEFDKLVEEKAAAKAAEREFNRSADQLYEQGVEKHGETFKEGVANLNALGLMTVPLVQAVLATGAGPEVMNALGSDVDEAARIAALPPHSMGVELAKLAQTLSAPKAQPQISRAPAPIAPVGGTNVQNLDVYDENLSMEEYARRRKAQGARWAR